MDAAGIQAKVYKGYAKAASRVGTFFDVYRPQGANLPLALANVIGRIPATFTPHSVNNFGFAKPSDFKSPLFHAMLDGTGLQRGDYLTGEGGTFFIASLDHLQPILAVGCNRVIRAAIRTESANEGVKSYGGNDVTHDTVVATGWPVAMLKGAKAVQDKTLPGDAGFGTFGITAPAIHGVNFVPAMIIHDDLGNRFTLQAMENTPLGWRLTAQLGVV